MGGGVDIPYPQFFSGSFSGSEDAYVVGRDTIRDPDGVTNETLERGGRQQYMRWRLMSTGSLAGIVADRTHLQIISTDDGTILDTTWGCPQHAVASRRGGGGVQKHQSSDYTSGHIFPGHDFGWFENESFCDGDL